MNPTPEQVAAAVALVERRNPQATHYDSGDGCAECGDPFPCDAWANLTVLAALTQAQAELAEANAAIRAVPSVVAGPLHPDWKAWRALPAVQRALKEGQ